MSLTSLNSYFATIYQSPPTDGLCKKFANIHGKSRGSVNKSCDIYSYFVGLIETRRGMSSISQADLLGKHIIKAALLYT